MQRVFLWFYCLPLFEAIVLIIIGTAIFRLLRKYFSHAPFWKTMTATALFLWMAVIFQSTLGQRTVGGNVSEPIVIPFYSYYTILTGGNKELFRTNFMNTVLFYPAGLLACALLPGYWRKRWKIILVTYLFASLSICIEYIQYRFHMGLSEMDDIIHNSLGALLGALACAIPPNPFTFPQIPDNRDIRRHNSTNKSSLR